MSGGDRLGGLGPKIDAFVRQKRAAGYGYRESGAILERFGAMAARRFPGEGRLTREVCDAWLEESAGLHQNTLLRRVSPVRQLAKYLRGIGEDAYVIPRKVPSKQAKYDPHIFTEGEVAAFFAAVDRCAPSPYAPWRCYVMQTAFRLLLTCGLRSSEARMLRTEDVDLSTGRIAIRRSKGWEARVVYVADDMLAMMRDYDSIVGAAFPGREPFFPNGRGGFYGKSTFGAWFHEFWDPLPEAAAAKGSPPRVHDFRHTFCVHRLNQWVREGRDANTLYPYLSEFVGHSRFADTDYYLTLAEPFYPEFRARMRAAGAPALPEVPHEAR